MPVEDVRADNSLLTRQYCRATMASSYMLCRPTFWCRPVVANDDPPVISARRPRTRWRDQQAGRTRQSPPKWQTLTIGTIRIQTDSHMVSHCDVCHNSSLGAESRSVLRARRQYGGSLVCK